MKPGLSRATVRVLEPSELTPKEKERLLGALEGFANLGNSLDDYLAFGRQNLDFFPLTITDEATLSLTPLPRPCFEVRASMSKELYQGLLSRRGGNATEGGEDSGHGDVRTWRRLLDWDPACHKLALFYRDELRQDWGPPEPGPHDFARGFEFLVSLGIKPAAWFADWQGAFNAVRESCPLAFVPAPEESQLEADWKTGSFEYAPVNDFQGAAYILFRQGWRAKRCTRCTRYVVADKPLQRYCSTECFAEARRERNLALWRKYGKKWRAPSKTAPHDQSKKATKKGAKQR